MLRGSPGSGRPWRGVYSQQELLNLPITDPEVRSVFLNSAIGRRHLSLPALGATARRVKETQADLLGKHKALAVDMGMRAMTRA